MATLRYKLKLAVLNKKNVGENPRSHLAQNINAPIIQDSYITRKSEEMRVVKQRSCPRSSIGRIAAFQALYTNLVFL